MLFTLPTGAFSLIKSTPSDLGLIIILGLLCTAIAYWMLTYALKPLQASTVSLILTFEPAYALILSYFILKQPMNYEVVFSLSVIIGASMFFSYVAKKSKTYTAL